MSKRLNQLFATLLSVAIIATSTLSGTTIVKAEGYDETSPQINSVSLSENSTTKYSVGETVNFVIDITEEETGVASCWFTVSNGETGEIVYVSISDAFAGKYYASLTIPNSFSNGDYYLSDCTCTDVVGNIGTFIGTGEPLFTVVNNSTDNTAPEIESITFKNEFVEPGEVQTAVVKCMDDDLSSINFNYLKLDGNGTTYSVSFVPENINDNGLYEIPFNIESSMINGDYFINWIEAYDVNGNKYATCPAPVFFTVANGTEETKGIVTINNIEISETEITVPGLTNVYIEGTVENSAYNNVEVMLSVQCGGNQGYSFYNETVEVVDGKFTVDGKLSFNSDCAVDTDLSLMVSITNDDTFYVEYVDQNIVLRKQDKEVYKQITINNPNIVNIINGMDDNGSLLVKSDRGTTNVSKEIFDTIKGTDKELVFDIDGIQWIFNGKDITEETKDININTSVQAVNATEYGYEEDTNAVALVFEANGILPGEAEIKIKSDYVANKFNVGDKLYLGFIKDSADSEEEVVSDNSVSMNEISYEDELIKIEDARVKYDGAYVSLFLTHNSSYILSDKMPTGKTTTEETEKPTAPVVPTQPQKPQQPTVTDKKEDSKPSVSNTEEKKTSKKVTVKSSKVTKLSKKSKNKVKVTIKKASKVTGYQIQISTSKKFKKSNTVTVTSKKTSKTVNIKKIKKNKKTKYYVRVRSYKVVNGKKYYSKWSSKKTVKM